MTYARTWAQTFGRAKPGRTIGRVAEIVKHTEAGSDFPATATVAQEAQRMRAIDAFHRSLGWGGFGYSAGDFPSGRVHEGRGWHRSGAHTRGRNTSALAIVTIGHGDRTPMTEPGIAGVRRWIGAGIAAGAVTPDPQISGHRDYAAKSCPGDRIYPQLGRLRGVAGPELHPSHDPWELDMQIHPHAVVASLPCNFPGCPGGWWELVADGGVLTKGTAHHRAHFRGSYHTLEARHRNAPRIFLTVTPRRDLRPGYTIWSATDGASYTF